MGLAHGWRPDMLSGQVLWLDADTVAGSDGDAIATWANKAPTGSANDVAQATVGRKPLLKKAGNGINGHNVLRFDGSDDFMRGTLDLGSTGCTFFFIARTGGSSTPYGSVIGSGGQGAGFDHPTTGIWWAFSLGNSGDAAEAGWAGPSGNINRGNFAFATDTVYYGRYSYNKIAWAQDGVNSDTPADTSFPSATYNTFIGCDSTAVSEATTWYAFLGDIAEVMIFNRQLSTYECTVVKKYLYTKYGL